MKVGGEKEYALCIGPEDQTLVDGGLRREGEDRVVGGQRGGEVAEAAGPSGNRSILGGPDKRRGD